MIDHLGIEVSDYQAAMKFYEHALAPLGYELLMQVQGYAGFGLKEATGPVAIFWIHQGDNPTQNVHIAFTANDRETVDAFYASAIHAGAKDNGAPGIREIYHPNYYGAFVLDFDGRNIEVVCHQAQ